MGEKAHTLARAQPLGEQVARFVRPPAEPTVSAASAAAMASSTVRAVSGWAMMSSTHASKENVAPDTAVEASAGAGAAATEAAIARATKGRVNLTILAVGCLEMKVVCDLRLAGREQIRGTLGAGPPLIYTQCLSHESSRRRRCGA